MSCDAASLAAAAAIDADATLPRKADFLIPRTPDAALYRTPSAQALYFCGNSLGLQPVGVRGALEEECAAWAEKGVEGHVTGSRPWVSIEDTVTPGLAALAGASRTEVACAGSLTTNLHLLMAAFYKPAGERTKIVLEEHAFPSDTYAVKSQCVMHGLNPEEHIVYVKPREGEQLIRDEDFLATIRATGVQLALVLLSGVQYYTGQLFDIPAVAAAAHEAGAMCGVDLAHAFGNVPLRLHDWNVDFAAWCSYKYLNAGPGAIAGYFVHDKYANESLSDRAFYAGWWGHDRASRFKMGSEFVPIPGAARFQLSNPPVFQIAALRASLDVFAAAGGMDPLRAKSLRLTGYLEQLLKEELSEEVTIITPADPARRGCQLSLEFRKPVRAVFNLLQREGIITDIREPFVMRVAPTPLYTSAADVLEFVTTLKLVLAEIEVTPLEKIPQAPNTH